jgi:hypothetical protein
MKHCDGVLVRHTFEFSYNRPGHVIVQCDCGETVTCTGSTNVCRCGAHYGGQGSPLTWQDGDGQLNTEEDTWADGSSTGSSTEEEEVGTKV